jgi:hypothetical protein
MQSTFRPRIEESEETNSLDIPLYYKDAVKGESVDYYI